MIKKISKKIREKSKKLSTKLKKAMSDGGLPAFLHTLWSYGTYFLYDRWKIRRLKKFPPKIVKHRILFSSKRDFSGNARALFDHMVARGLNESYELVWLVKEPKKYKKYERHNVKFIREFKKGTKTRSARVYKYALTSKDIFYNREFDWINMSRKGQLFIDLWSGCGYQEAKEQERIFFDYCLLPGEVFLPSKKKYFGCTSKKFLALGYPRYDRLCTDRSEAEKFCKNLLAKADCSKLVCWMPEHAGENGTGLSESILDQEEKIQYLDELCKENHILLLLKNSKLQEQYDLSKLKLTNILIIEDDDLNKRDLMMEDILHYTDALMTDVSSYAIDYLLLNRPIGYVLKEDESLELENQVFERTEDYMPGMKIQTMQELKKFLLSVAEEDDVYREQREAVRDQLHNPSEHYCRRLLDYIHLI